MPLEKESYEEAKQRAQQRIAEWVAETKAAGIIRLQDRYGGVFKTMGWRDTGTSKNTRPAKASKLKPVLGKTKHGPKTTLENQQMAELGHSTPDIPPSRLSRLSRNQSRCKSRARSRQTMERCQSSRLTSDKRSESRRRFRDSASLIFGDNRNNRSSMLASVCSDALSLIQDSAVSDWLESKCNGKEKSKTAERNFLKMSHPSGNYKTGKPPSYIPVHRDTIASKRKYSKRPSVFPANFQKRRRTIKPADKDIPCFEFDDKEISTNTQPSSLSSTANMTELHTSLSNRGLTVGTSLSRPVSKTGIRPMTQASTWKMDASVKMALTVTSGLSQSKSTTLSKRRLLSKSAFKLKTNKGSTGSDSSKVSSPDMYVRCTVRGKIALRRFRTLVRMIMCVLLILRSSVKTVQKSTKRDVSKKKKKKGALMAFDPAYYSSATTTYGHLSQRSRDALQKLPQQRTEVDIRVLTEVMCRLPLFARYSRKVKEELARVVWYDMYENGRIIIKQGDTGSRMYFIVSGVVSVHRTEEDTVTGWFPYRKHVYLKQPWFERKSYTIVKSSQHIIVRYKMFVEDTGAKVVQHLRDMEMGSTFGELALIRNIARTYTAVCKGDAEFLSVDKDQFNKVLRENWEESWQNRYNFLTSSSYFMEWTKEQLKQTSDVGIIKEYNTNAVIFGDEKKLTDWVYFILRGKCQLVKKLTMIRSKSPYLRSCLTLPGSRMDKYKDFLDKPYGKKIRQLETGTHFLTVTTLQKGDYFGVGENMSDCYIVASTKTECLLLNAASYSIHSKRDELKKLAEKRDLLLPTSKDLHRRFEINRRWWEYKKKVVSEVVNRRSIPNNTTIADVPRPIAEDEGIPEWVALE